MIFHSEFLKIVQPSLTDSTPVNYYGYRAKVEYRKCVISVEVCHEIAFYHSLD